MAKLTGYRHKGKRVSCEYQPSKYPGYAVVIPGRKKKGTNYRELKVVAGETSLMHAKSTGQLYAFKGKDVYLMKQVGKIKSCKLR